MKRLLLLSLVVFSTLVNAQDNAYKRSAIFFEDQSKFPKTMDNVKQWLIGFTSQLPFQFRNAQSSSRNDARFEQFSLSLAEKKTFSIGNSDCRFSIGSPDQKRSVINVQHEGKWPISAYQPGFDLYAFNPSDNATIFSTSLLIYNISEEQAMAQFINNFVGGETKSAIEKYVGDIEKSTRKKLEITDFENLRLTELAKIIYAKTGKYASDVSYEIYIKGKDQKKEDAKMHAFFKRYTAGKSVVNDFLERITPQGRCYFEKPGVALELPAKAFTFAGETSPSVAFNFKYCGYKIYYDKALKPYMSLKFEKPTPVENVNFELVNEYELNKKMFMGFGFSKHQTFRAIDVKQITLHLYGDRLKVYMVIKSEDALEREYCLWDEKIRLN